MTAPWIITALSLAALLFLALKYFKLKQNLPGPAEGLPTPVPEEDGLLHTLIDSMPDWIYIKDRDSRYILTNKHLARNHGINNPAEMRGLTDYDYYPEETARVFFEDEQRIMKGGTPLINQEERLMDPGGREVILSTTKIPFFDADGEVAGLVGIGRDISAQKEDRERLKELSLVASGTENVVVIMDREGNFKWANKGFESRYGRTLEEFIGEKGSNLKESSSKVEIKEILEEVRSTGKAYTYTSRTQDHESRDAWYQTNITPILGSDGKLSSMFLIDSDITALKKADLKIKQQKYELESQRDQLKNLNASKDRLFSIIAHDLKNPFQSIIGFSEILREDFRALKMNQVEEYLECIHTSSTTAYDLLYNLLEWARSQTQSVKIKPVQIVAKDLCNEIFELYSAQAKAKQIHLKNRLNPELRLLADQNMLNTVIRNLVANGLKYTAPGGTITISGAVNEQMVDIKVSDTGVGMEDEKVKTLFSLEKGKSTPGTSGELGTGLGLLVCFEFLKLNKGSFRVDSKLGEGSAFTISLPLKAG